MPRQRRIAEVIAESGSSLMAMINELSDPSGIEAGELRLESVPVDLCDVVEGVCSLFWDGAMLKGIDLSAYVDPATPRLIFGDPTRLRQVIGALVNNAIRSTKTGGVLVEVEPDSAGSLRISVRDTRFGITREEIADVFAELTPADQRQARKAGGVGLGLTISEKLGRAMGGCLRVTSEVGRGSTFAFRLPTTVAEGATAWPTTNAGKVPPLWRTRACPPAGRSAATWLAGYKVEAEADDLALVLGTAASLQALNRPGVPAIRLDEPGSSAPDQAPRDGGDQAVMIQPFRRRELKILFGQLARGEPLRDRTSCKPVPMRGVAQMRPSVAEPLREVG